MLKFRKKRLAALALALVMMLGSLVFAPVDVQANPAVLTAPVVTRVNNIISWQPASPVGAYRVYAWPQGADIENDPHVDMYDVYAISSPGRSFDLFWLHVTPSLVGEDYIVHVFALDIDPGPSGYVLSGPSNAIQYTAYAFEVTFTALNSLTANHAIFFPGISHRPNHPYGNNLSLVPMGSFINFIVEPAAGYRLVSRRLNGTPIDDGPPATSLDFNLNPFANPDFEYTRTNHHIEFVFEPIPAQEHTVSLNMEGHYFPGTSVTARILPTTPIIEHTVRGDSPTRPLDFDVPEGTWISVENIPFAGEVLFEHWRWASGGFEHIDSRNPLPLRVWGDTEITAIFVVGPVSINVTAQGGATTVQAGTTLQFNREVLPAAASQDVMWSVTDNNGQAVSGVSIDSNGLLTVASTVLGGTVLEITAESAIRSAVSGFATVTVTPPPPTPVLTVNPTSVTLNAAGTGTLTASLTLGGTFTGPVSWSASNPAVVAVSLTTGQHSQQATITAGNVTTQQTATITALYGGQTATVNVTVNPADTGPPPITPPTSVTVTTQNGATNVGRGGSLQFNAAVGPAGASQNVVWSIVPPVAGVSISEQGLLSVLSTVPLNTQITVRATAQGFPNIHHQLTVGVTETTGPFAVSVVGSHGHPDGSGNYFPGQHVTIRAGSQIGIPFTGWTASHTLNFVSGSTSSSTATFVMPAHPITLTATWGPVFENVPPYVGWVFVGDSRAPAGIHGSGEGPHRFGDLVTIRAGLPAPGYRFAEWRTAPHQQHDIAFEDPFSPVTRFIMPSVRNVTVWAHWIPIDDDWPDSEQDIWNWNIGAWQQRSGGVSFSYLGDTFPTNVVANLGANLSFSVRVNRLSTHPNASFVGQWMRNGLTHGDSFTIAMGPGGAADINLNLPNINVTQGGAYSLRVATMLGTVTTHVDVSRVLNLAVQTPAVTAADAQVPIASQSPRPLGPTVPDRPGLPALPDHNHNEVVRLVSETGPGEPIVLSLHGGVNELRLHGRTLDTLISSNRPLFVANDILWAALPPGFLAEFRDLGGNLIGQNGGTFDIYVRPFKDGGNPSAGEINFATTINGLTRAHRDFNSHYTVLVELGAFGTANPQRLAALKDSRNLGANIDRGTGVMSFATQTTGRFTIAFVVN